MAAAVRVRELQQKLEQYRAEQAALLQGIAAAVTVGMLASLGWILLSADTFEKVYGLSRDASPVPFSQPGLVTIPLGFVVLVVVSLLTRPEPKGNPA